MSHRIRELSARLWWRRILRRGGRSCADLEQFPSLSPDEQRRQLSNLLLAQIKYFGAREDAIPEWREASRINDADELWKIWPSLPIVGKDTLRRRFDSQQLKNRLGLGGKLDSTGGSTGEPTHFFHDPEMIRATTAASCFTRLQMGWRPGMPTIIVWGSERDIGKTTAWRTRLYLELCRDHLVDGYRLTPITVERVLRLLRSERSVAMYGFSSMLEYVARHILEQGIQVPAGVVKTAWNGGEMLFREQSTTFAAAFGVRILNCYGGRELGVMACQFRPDLALHVLRPWVFVEIVDDTGREVSPGEPGRMLWTSTICRGTPFLRYDIGDLATYERTGCDESGVHDIDELQGRTASLLKLPNGRVINNIFWNHLFKDFVEVQQFQIVVRNPDAGGLRILLQGKGFSPDREKQCWRALEGLLGEIPKEFVWVERIPLTSQGKLLQVVRESPAHEKSE
jgi:phenylacetate-coenzyme A ligase PaaK-like adenylate-forming protein